MPVQEKHNVMEMYISLQATVQCITWKINYIKMFFFFYFFLICSELSAIPIIQHLYASQMILQSNTHRDCKKF